MNYTILIIIGLVGVALGMYLARRGADDGSTAEPLDWFDTAHHKCPQDEQTEKKMENKQKILAFVQEHGQIQNNDVEKLVGVSNATAERYLAELEREGKLIQHGTIGPDVFYTGN